MTLEIRPIGTIHTPFVRPAGTPIQPVYADGVEGTVEVFEPFAEALADLEGFDRIWLLYWFNKSAGAKMRVIPYRDTQERGLFATRAPARPNAIGLSCVALRSIEGNVLHVADLDILDGTPLLDIKPYVPSFDSFPAARCGWVSEQRTERTLADQRFHNTNDPGNGGMSAAPSLNDSPAHKKGQEHSMPDNPDKDRLGSVDTPRGTEIRLSPDCTAGYLLGNLQRAHQRASALLAELIKATRQPGPDLEQVRELAMSVRFEVDLAQTLAQPLVDTQEIPAAAS